MLGSRAMTQMLARLAGNMQSLAEEGHRRPDVGKAEPDGGAVAVASGAPSASGRARRGEGEHLHRRAVPDA